MRVFVNSSISRASAFPLERTKSVLREPAVIALATFVLRLAVIVVAHTYRIPDRTRSWSFAYEMGAIGGSLAAGHGFQSPFSPSGGPTAWVGPAYPLLLAGIFKLFGIYTNLSAFVSLALNSVFAALNAWIIFLMARDLFGKRVALISAWAWAVLPYAIFWPTHWIWETSLSALLLSLAFLWTLRLQGNTNWRAWAGFGFFWALLALTNATLLSFLPVSVIWLVLHPGVRRRGGVAPIAALAVGLVVGISPWVIRNYAVFDRVVVLRSDFGEELWAGNHEGSDGVYWEVKPWNLSKLRRMGEIGYMAKRRDKALQFIAAHPGSFAGLTAKRVAYFWCDVPWGWRVPHFGTGTRLSLHFTFTVLALWGLWEAHRRRTKGILLFAGLFALYPLVYYITHVEPRYKHPITPQMLILAVYLFCSAAEQPSSLVAILRKRKQRLELGSTVRVS